MLRRVLAVSSVAFALAACGDAQVSLGPDRGSVEGRLAEIGVSMADVDSVEFVTERGGEGAVLNRWAWAKMKTCDGYIVVKTSGGLGRSGSAPYGTGSCILPDHR